MSTGVHGDESPGTDLAVADGGYTYNELPEIPDYLDAVAVEVLDKLSAHQRAFLTAYAHNGGNVTAAAEQSGLTRWAHYAWMERHEHYRHAFEWARQAMIDFMESEAMRRAINGWEEPVYYLGEEVGTKTRFSDTLLIFMLKGAAPAKYAEFSVQTRNVRSETTVNVNVNVRARISEELEALNGRLTEEQERAHRALTESDDDIVDAELIDE